MAKIILEKIVSENVDLMYSSLQKTWQIQDAKGFAEGKDLYAYQIKALENMASVLHLAFDGQENEEANTKNILKKYSNYGVSLDPVNRACFWMATGSGKTLVLIKTIEHIDYLMSQGLIPQKEILLLLPKEDLIKQLKEEVAAYNQSHSGGRTISLVNLLKYEEEKINTLTFLEEIKVYYYRSDLLRDERKETILDYKNYENDGNWYVFLDEAHRGDSENSNLKDYVNKLTAKGFLFNFSATFTDDIDILTTCYNFNLEKFITAGYGKNIYLSKSQYTLGKGETDFSEVEKQKQVLKSFLVYTIISKKRMPNSYHKPLIMTLVNSVNRNDKGNNSDLKIFCDYMLQIAQDKVSLDVLKSAKEELINEFGRGIAYVFGKEKLTITSSEINAVTFSDIREKSFNSKTKGDLEYYEGIKGKEIVFKLQSSSTPFALIRIGETAPFIKNYLQGYNKLNTFANKDWFRELNNPISTINVLLGSRVFYEGWDSNRPNVINFINIGKGEAKKFVPQSIGRGVRIQPDANKESNRKRLMPHDPSKNNLLETLFIFSSDAASIDTILNAMTELGGESAKKESVVLFDEDPSLFELSEKAFELLLPLYKEKEMKSAATLRFNIEDGCKKRLNELIETMSPATFLISSNRSYRDNWDVKKFIALKEFMQSNKFVSDPSKDFRSYDYLVSDLRRHILTSEKGVEGVRLINENSEEEKDNDIIHFKHISVKLDDKKRREFVDMIASVKNFGKLTTEEIKEKNPLDLARLTDSEYMKDYTTNLTKLSGKESEVFTENSLALNMRNLANHYYQPLLYAEVDAIDWINHVIREDSERVFVRNLQEYIKNNSSKIKSEWMFSKVDETLDKNIAMPYFADNQYKSFFPDFIFWIKNGNDYRIVFVDPKGPAYTNYELKVDGFEKLFKDKVFSYNGKDNEYRVTFDLKLVGEYQGGEKYASYWINPNNFSWLI